MELIINTPGTKIRRESGCFLIKNDNGIKKIAAKKIEQLLISSSASISSDALCLAVENSIDVVFLDKMGNTFARVWAPNIKRSTELRRKQLMLQENELGSRLIVHWINQKITLQQKHLKSIQERAGEKISVRLEDSIRNIEELKQKILALDLHTAAYHLRSTIQGYEGNISKIYFRSLNEVLPNTYQFEMRSKHPAKDPFNSMLNYGYGVLYGHIEKACILAGLDPYVGIMHADQYNKPVLTYDLVEMFRVYIDKLVVKLCREQIMPENAFTVLEDGSVYMSEEGKRIFLINFNQLLEENKRYKNKQMKVKEIFLYESHQIAKYIMDDGISDYISHL